MKKIKVGVIGCGAIGSFICESILKEIPQLELYAIYDKEEEKAKELLRRLSTGIKIMDGEELIEEADLIVEAASKEAVLRYIRKAINLGKDVLIMSVGGLVEDISLIDLAREKGSKIYIPSGAIAGIDGIKASLGGKVKRVEINTIKSPKSLKSAPYILENNIELDSLKEKTKLFEGDAQKAIKAFPKNINVSATLSLAGIGFEKTKVVIYADPYVKTNTHIIYIEGDFGKIEIKCENMPSPFNPKTSFLASLSAIATLKQIVDPIKIGS